MKKSARIQLFLKILACPYCGAGLSFRSDRFRCNTCKKNYEYKNDIPVFIDGAAKTSHDKKQTEIYDREYSDKRYSTILENWQQSYVNRIVKLFDLDKPSRADRWYLDIGAGPGHTIVEIARKGIYTVGCDISYEGALAAGKRAKKLKAYDKCLYVVCDAARMPFKKNTFNFASCIMLLEHLQNDYDVVEGIADVLKPKGLCYIAVPNAYINIWFFMWPLNYWHDRRLGHLRHYSAQRLQTLCRTYKLIKKEIYYSAHIIKFAQLLYTILPTSLQNKAWWYMESIDEKQSGAKTGLHLNGIFTKK